MENIRLKGNTEKALCFIDQWNDSNDYILAHTSGSTGTPKQIRLLKSDMRASAETTCNFFGITSQSHLHLPLSVDYIAGKMMIVRAIVSGSELCIETPSNSPQISNLVNHRISLLATVPSQIPYLLKSDILTHIDNLIIGGAPLQPALEKQLLQSPCNIYCTYGMTETCSHIALRKIGTDFYHAIGNTTFSIDNRNCLICDLPHLSVGRVITNDIVQLIDSRNFRWIGRYDNVINSGGIKIYPEEIEKALAHLFPDIAFYITSRSSIKWGEELILVVESTKIDPHIKERIKEILPPYHIPKEIIAVQLIQRTSSGKIIRNKF